MALQQEILKTAGVASLALLQVLGFSVLPGPSVVTLAVIQIFALLNALVALPPSKAAKIDFDTVTASPSLAQVLAPSRTKTLVTNTLWCVAFLVLALVFGRVLHATNLCSSFPKVGALACVFGGLAHRVSTLISKASSEGSCDACACDSTGMCTEGCCPYSASFWQQCPEAAEEEQDLECKELCASPLDNLEELFCGLPDLLSEPLCFAQEEVEPLCFAEEY